MRFDKSPRKWTVTGIEIGASGGNTGAERGATTTTDFSFVGTKDSEASRPTAIEDEEVQLRKVPSLVAHDAP
jgi:hypothetical protein